MSDLNQTEPISNAMRHNMIIENNPQAMRESELNVCGTMHRVVV